MKIAPNKIWLKIDEPQAGSLNLSSRPTSVEVGEIVACGPMTEPYKKGDKIMFKSWGVDIVDHEGKKYYFIDLDTHCICAII